MKKRIIGLDILRVLGIVFIFLYHVTDSYVGLGGTGDGVFSSLALFSILSRPASIFLFLISGFALMYNREGELKLKDYYIRRFKSLYIPFYVAYILMLGIGVVLLKWAPWNYIPKRKFVYTILGIDGLAVKYSPNYY
jgi:peptidoglycan/LPS O-acetylase OafA/YrhL